jgi:hypothetical protein
LSNRTPKWLRLGFFDAVPFWYGLHDFAALWERRLRRLLHRLNDLDPRRPATPGKRLSYFPEGLLYARTK